MLGSSGYNRTMADSSEPAFKLMKVKELKDFLKHHRQLTSGKKEELVRRARGTYELAIQRACDEATRKTHNGTADEECEKENHEPGKHLLRICLKEKEIGTMDGRICKLIS